MVLMKSPHNLGRIMGKEIRLTKENILAFIGAVDMSEDEKREHLQSQLTLDLLNGPYIFNRTLFHFLVLHNLPTLFESIIAQDERFRHCALLSDRFGRNLLHVAASKEDDNSKLLETVLRTLPELLNNTNERGDTALDTAINIKNAWAIEAILAAKYKFPQLRGVNPKIRPSNRACFPVDSAYKNLRMETGLDVLKVFPAVDPIERGDSRVLNKSFLVMFPHLFSKNYPAVKSKSGLYDSPKSTGSSPKSSNSSPKSTDSSPKGANLASLGAHVSLSSSGEIDVARSSPSQKSIFKNFPPLSRSGSPLLNSSSRSSNGGSPRTSEDFSMSATTTTTTTTSTTDLTKTALTNSSDLVRNLLSSDVAALESYLQSGKAPNIVNYLGRPLVIQAFFQAVSAYAFEDEPLAAEPQVRFNTVLAYADLEYIGTRNKVLREYLNGREKAREVIQLACVSLHQRVAVLSTELAFTLNQKSNDVNKSLYDNGLVECYRKSVSKPDITILYPDDAPQQEVALAVWDLCTLTNKDRYFDKKELCRLILGIQGVISVKNIMRALIHLYPYFDRYQKLIAGFIVKELILTVNSKEGLDACILTLRSFLEQNINPDTGLAQDGARYNGLMNELVELKYAFFKNPAVINHEELNNWLVHESTLMLTEGCSFDTLTHNTLNKPAKERREEIKLIAAELRKLSLYYYQDISLGEYERSAWIKDQKEVKSPHIVSTTKMFNCLTDYFALIILSQGANNIDNSLNFMAELACELASHEEGPDLNSLMAISGALNKSQVSRLMTLSTALDKNDAATLAELQELVDSRENYRTLRTVMSSFPGAVLFTGLLLGDLTKSMESSRVLTAADAMAPFFTMILRVKELAQKQSLTFSTDILRFFNYQFIRPMDESLDCMSFRIRPLTGDFINLNQIKDYRELFQKLYEDYIKKKLVPVIVYNDITYPLQRTPQLLLHWVLTRREAQFTFNYPGPQPIGVDDLKNFEVMLDEFRTILMHDYTFDHAFNINPLFYKSRLMLARREELPSCLTMPVDEGTIDPRQ